MAADVSFLVYFLPIITFLIVFLVSFAVIKKIGLDYGHQFWQVFLAFLVACIFVVAAEPRAYVESIVPWFAVLLISFFLIMALLKFMNFNDWDKNLAKAFGVILLVMFVISGIFVFSSYFAPYLPWNAPVGANPDVRTVTDWVFSPRVWGAIILVGISALVSFVLVKNAAKPAKGK